MKTYSIISSIAFVILLFFSCGPSLHETGIPTEGTILSKRDLGLGKNKKFYITVNYFTQPDKENPQPDQPKDSNRTVEEIIEDIGKINLEIGDYYSTEISVSRTEYSNYNEGDKVQLKYEKGNPKHVIIDEK